MSKNEHNTQPLILIVDDIPKNLQVLGSILNLESYQIAFASSGMQALTVLETTKPDLVLLDIMMPEMDGFEVCTYIKSNPDLKDIPVIFITGKAEQEDIVTGLKLGAVDYITKPFNTPELLTRVKTHIELKRSKDDIRKYAVELEQARDELTLLNASKDKFFSIVAHDLRSPFSGFLGLTQLLLEDYNRLKPDDMQQIASSMNKAAIKLYSFLENLLQWSKSQMGHISLNSTKLELNDIFNRIQFILSDTIADKNITITNNIPKDLFVSADNNTLDTAIRNLVTNAIKFTPQQGTIDFNLLDVTPDMVLFEISDSGVGIPPDSLSKLFRIDSKVITIGTANERGSGLGLLLVKEFIEKNNGTIALESKINFGTKAKISLPRYL